MVCEATGSGAAGYGREGLAGPMTSLLPLDR
jgi:hypothetical protein